jgi:lipopolysaccharide export LptBFGC system permease protein LptF
MAVNEDEQSLHNNSAHSTGSRSRVQEETEIITIEEEKKDEAVLYGLLGLNIDGDSALNGLDVQKGSLSAVDEKTWDSMDSVHSRCSTVTSQYFSAGNSSADDSFNYNDSGDSFASFGDSFNELSSAAVSEIKDTFTELDDDKPKPPPPRRAPLMKQNSLRFTRGASFRGSLSLIEEKSSEFEPA